MTLKQETKAYQLVSKRILKSKLSENPDKLAEYKTDIIAAYNRVITYIVGRYPTASVEDKNHYKNTVTKLRLKQTECFKRLNLSCKFSATAWNVIDQSEL